MAITSEVSICNLALSKIGARKSISSLTEAGLEAETCNLHYEHLRDMLLQSHPWNFAIARASLSENATSPAFEYENQFYLPADYLRAIKLYNESQSWKVEGDQLLTDANTVNLIYIKKQTNPTFFPPLFVECLATLLAAEIEEEITNDTSKSAKLRQEFKEKFREAKRRDGQEGTPDRIISNGPAGFKSGIYSGNFSPNDPSVII